MLLSIHLKIQIDEYEVSLKTYDSFFLVGFKWRGEWRIVSECFTGQGHARVLV